MFLDRAQYAWLGFPAKAYENALAHELRKRGMSVRRQFHMTVTYDGVSDGKYAANFLVENRLPGELEAATVCMKFITRNASMT